MEDFVINFFPNNRVDYSILHLPILVAFSMCFYYIFKNYWQA